MDSNRFVRTCPIHDHRLEHIPKNSSVSIVFVLCVLESTTDCLVFMPLLRHNHEYQNTCIMTHFVYFFKCSCCAATYVGRSYRHKQVRLCEHAGLSPHTGKAYKQTLVNASSIKEHMITENHPVDPVNDFKILSRGGTREILDIKESIMIGRLNPTLNEREKSAPLSLYD